MTFLDASVLLAAEDDSDPHFDAAVALLKRSPIGTLDLAYYEVTNVADRGWRNPSAGGRLRQRIQIIADLGTLIRTDRELAARAASLVYERGLSAYDAAYVAAAERAGMTLASCDVRDLVSKGLARLPGDILADG